MEWNEKEMKNGFHYRSRGQENVLLIRILVSSEDKVRTSWKLRFLRVKMSQTNDYTLYFAHETLNSTADKGCFWLQSNVAADDSTVLRHSGGELRHYVRAEGWQPYAVPDVHAACVRAVLRRRAAELRRGVEGSDAQGEGGVCETVAASAEAVCEVDDGGVLSGDTYNCVADSNHSPPTLPDRLY